jgi:hypothetical protein
MGIEIAVWAFFDAPRYVDVQAEQRQRVLTALAWLCSLTLNLN